VFRSSRQERLHDVIETVIGFRRADDELNRRAETAGQRRRLGDEEVVEHRKLRHGLLNIVLYLDGIFIPLIPWLQGEELEHAGKGIELKDEVSARVVLQRGINALENSRYCVTDAVGLGGPKAKMKPWSSWGAKFLLSRHPKRARSDNNHDLRKPASRARN
jgi:hypothetical protein